MPQTLVPCYLDRWDLFNTLILHNTIVAIPKQKGIQGICHYDKQSLLVIVKDDLDVPIGNQYDRLLSFSY